MTKFLSLLTATTLLFSSSALANSEYADPEQPLAFEKCERNGHEVLLPKGDCARLTKSKTGAEVTYEAVETEKCYGIAKAGENDGIEDVKDGAKKSKKDNDPRAWIDVPLNTCAHLGGKLEAAA